MDGLEGMDEIVQEFLVESHENLDQLDRDLVALEAEPGSRDLLSSIFRTIHTIKGTSGFLAFSKLESLTHVGENLLSRLRDGELPMTAATTDALLRMVDDVRSLLSRIEQDGTEGAVDVSGAVALVEACLNGSAVTAAPAEPAPVAEPVAEEAPKPAAKRRTRKPAAPRAPKAAAAPAEPVTAPAPTVVAPPVAPTSVEAEHHPEPGTENPARRTAADSTIRVDVDQLDLLMRLVGELVLTRNQLIQRASAEHDMDLLRMTQRLNLVTSELQEGVMKTRMQPIDHVWSKLPRVVRDLSSMLGKQISLEMHGKETELDRTLLEAIKDPLTHIVRNSVDHGIETPEARRAAGKPETGLLRLRAFHEGGRVVVEILDDGAGIDPAKIGAKAVERGIITSAQLAAMPEREVLMLIFKAGFSTAEKVTNVSGRGVGMDVVRTNIEKIGGTVDLSSVPGQGSTFRLTIPLTLAIVPALTVECAGERYAVPQISLLEVVSVDASRGTTAIEQVSGAPVYRLRGRLLPLVDLADVLGLEGKRRDGLLNIAVLQSEGRTFGLILDRVLNSEEIVVKPLSSRLKGIGVYSGATILGDGSVALILDIQALAAGALSSEGAKRAAAVEQHTAAVVEAEKLLVAQVAGGRRVAIPLDMVTRLEEFPTDKVQHVGSREVVEYRNEILPLVRLSQHLGSFDDGTGERLPMIVSSRGGRSVALVVDRIIDIVEEGVHARSDVDDIGLLGSALIQQQVVELLDVRQAILAADPHFPLDPILPGDPAAAYDPAAAAAEAFSLEGISL
ncbi:two-component system chemotaxis sensor kinase CheA [Motilibacter peucedani]|uniref:histidine kinase n=1 Tax=Motilibacter peucedani TaxID=598650 RepID=A0A420XTN3_9ACTN|nr:chemotaxis protein CheW [Motilibacter peucedani]RKS80195.1 two-component system chemotaxis sensor kinase CheA [Motilibacter peucedani]